MGHLWKILLRKSQELLKKKTGEGPAKSATRNKRAFVVHNMIEFPFESPGMLDGISLLIPAEIPSAIPTRISPENPTRTLGGTVQDILPWFVPEVYPAIPPKASSEILS